MSYDRLITAIKRDGAAVISSIGEDADNIIAEIKSKNQMRLDEIKVAHDRSLNTECALIKNAILSEAQKEAGAIRLKAERGLLIRLQAVCASILPELRTERFKDIFRALCSELPPAEYASVYVNPDDEALACEVFKDADIRADKSISGGLEAHGDGLTVINTFEKRLQRAFEGMQWQMVVEVYEKLDVQARK